MPQLDQTHVLVENAIVVWDAITRPDVRDDGSKSHKLKVVIPPGSQDAQLVEAMAAQCLQESKWKGVMPNGGNFAINQVQPGEFNNMYNGGYVINPSTNRLPDIFDESGNRLDPMQYGNLLYGGQVVSVIVHCWDYDNKSKGIATGLDGVRIHTSLNAPQQQFGGGGYDAASAFGNQGQQQNGGQNFNQGQQQNGGQNFNQGQQQNGGQNFNQGQQQNGGQNFNQGANPGQQQTMQQGGQQQNGGQNFNQGQQQNGGQPMQQANNFLPNQQ